MKPSPAVILLVRDSDGFGLALAGGMLPAPDSPLRREESEIQLALDKYGITDCEDATIRVVQILNSDGSAQLSILLMPDYKQPIAACAVKEVLALLTSEHKPVVLVPLVMRAMKLNDETRSDVIYSAEMGTSTDLIRSLLAGTAKAPPSLRINSEPLACLLEMAAVMNLAIVLMATQCSQSPTHGTSECEMKALSELGQFVASRMGLCFARDKMQLLRNDRADVNQEPWRALYG